jgi:hypothetical protein
VTSITDATGPMQTEKFDLLELDRTTDSRNRDLLLLFAAPVIVLLVLRVSPYFRLNNGDPFIYVGYSNAFRTHVERFGYTYHSVRFGLIFPLRLSLMFGPVWGYFLLRYLLYAVTILPMWVVLRPLGRRIALLGPVIFISSPVTAQAILTTHPDTIVVPGVTVTLCLLTLAVRSEQRLRTSLLALGAGLAAGITVNANIFSGPLLALIITASIVAMLMCRRFANASIVAVVVLFGMLAVCATGMLVYQRMFGVANIYQTTLNAMRDISNSEIWRTPSLEWMSTRRYIYAPVVVLIFATWALIRCRRRLSLPDPDQLLLYAAVLLGFLYFAAHQFLLGGTSMEQAYYYSYLIGPVAVLAAAAIAWQGGTAQLPGWALVAFPVGLAYVCQVVEIRWFVVFVASALALMAIMFRVKAVGSGLLMLFMIHLAWGASPRTIAPIDGAGFQYEPHYERVFGDADSSALEAYLLASDLPSVVPSEPTFVVPLLFWYRTGDPLLDSVEATYLWETLAVQRFPAPGMPVISQEDLDRLDSLVGGYVVLIGRTDAELDAGVEALLQRGFQLGSSARTEQLTRGASTVFVRPVRVTAAPTD